MENQNHTLSTPTNLKLHFNLKQVRDTEKLTQIMLVTTVNKQRIRIYTKLRIEPKYWDKTDARCCTDRRMSLRDKQRLQQINRQIEQLSVAVHQLDGVLAESGRYLSPSDIRKVVEEKTTPETMTTHPISYLYRQVDEYLQNVNRRGKRGIASTQKTYCTALKRLENYCKEQHINLRSFDDFDKKFFTGFANYLYTCSYPKGDERKLYTQNTIINTLKVIKNLLHRSYDNEMTNNNYYQKVQTTLSADVSEQIYLQEKEIRKLAGMPVVHPYERQIRDMFVISCYTALRISDMQRLNEADIQNGIISLYQTKTKERVEIPILKEIAGIVAHYQANGFPTFGAAKANETIKQLAKRCGINEIIHTKEYRGGTTHIKSLPKWQMISFHTARRSCITNLYKRGYPINYIMTLSGHRSVQAFQRYMRASSKELMHSFVNLLKKEKAL